MSGAYIRKGLLGTNAVAHLASFSGGATFEMIELNTEKCIFLLIKIPATQRLINGRRQGKVAER